MMQSMNRFHASPAAPSSAPRSLALRRLVFAAFAFLAILAMPCGALVAGALAQDNPPAPNPDFDAFLQELWPQAQAKGVTRATFDQAFAGIAPDPRVMALTRSQPEYGKPVGAYVNMMASPTRIEA